MVTVMVGIVHVLQRILLVWSYRWYRLVTPTALRDSIDWVVGPDEIASMTFFSSSALPNAHSVVLTAKGFYAHGYDTVIAPSPFAKLKRVVLGPIILAANIVITVLTAGASTAVVAGGKAGACGHTR